MNTWLISARTDAFDWDRAFAESKDNCVDQQQQPNGKFEPGDIVYIYCSNEKAIKYKCLVKQAHIPNAEAIDDTKYVLAPAFFAAKKKTSKFSVRLQLFEKVKIDFSSFAKYVKNQQPLHTQQLIKKDFVEFLESITSAVGVDKDGGTVTEKQQLYSARVGQGLFRERVIALDKKCIVTGVDDRALLNASHIKAWSESTDEERLDGNNGILLSPHLDKLFDKHCISFSDTGKILVFDENAKNALSRWSIDIDKEYCRFSKERIQYLEHHRKLCEDKQ